MKNYLSLAFLILILNLCSSLYAQWVQTGPPGGGTVRSLFANDLYVLAGTTGFGVYISTNNGGTWTQTSLNNQDVRAITVSGSNTLAGMRSKGVCLSSNNGGSWIQTNINNMGVYSLVSRDSYVFAGTYGYGVYLSTNHGSTWTQTSFKKMWIYSLAVSGSNIFAGTIGSGVYLSTDNGLTWAQRNEGLYTGNPFILSLLIANNYVFTGTSNHSVWRRPYSELVEIEPISNLVPKGFKLYQNYPNPFNPATTIKFDIPPFTKGGQGGFVTLKIYDILGREVATLVNEGLKPGTYEVQWDGSSYSSGVYFYRLETSEITQSKKLILLK